MRLSLFSKKCYSLTMLMLAIILCSLTVTAQEKNESIWHPKAIYIVWPDMKLDILLPNEQDQSGVANLLFINSVSGKIYLLDSLKNNPFYKSDTFGTKSIAHIKDARYYTRFERGNYDAILLYNNGKYIRYNDIHFDKDVHKVIDMREEPVQLIDVESQNWLALRKFNTIIGERELPKNDTTVSDNKISGYVFWGQDDGPALRGAIVSYLPVNKQKRGVVSAYDGYFEIAIDSNDVKPNLQLWYVGSEPQKINVTANSSVFFVLKPVVLTEEQLKVTTGPLIRKNK